jgi:ABC-type Fe3+/spermidine/putrescine transport system ATPase subunit
LAVETSIGRVVTEGHAEVGSKVHISIRPECIRVGQASEAGAVPLGNARLDDFIFQGTHRRCQADVGVGGRTKLLLRLPPELELAAEQVADLWVRTQDVILIKEERS